MLQRKFLGWSAPFLPLLVDHLLHDRAALASTLVVVPTSQSGRILRESLAARASSLLAPTVATPGSLLHLDDPRIAPPWLEKIAWIETLESIPQSGWESYSDLLPLPPDTSDMSSDWASSLASEIVSLRATLQEHLHNLFTASKFLATTPEAGRWENLARLETLVEKRLAAWSHTSRSTALRNGFNLPVGFSHIILAGVTEMPSCLREAFEKYSGTVTALIAAPASEEESFSSLGLPLGSWVSREIQLPEDVRIVADPAQQAAAALDAIASTGASSTGIALGSADKQTGTTLARSLTENGWPAFHPAATQPLPGLLRWLQVWKKWLHKPSSRNLASLLSLPESSALISGYRAQKLLTLSKLRDKHPTCEPAALLDILTASDQKPEQDLRAALSTLLTLRQRFISADFPGAILSHISDIRLNDDVSARTFARISEFLEVAAPVLTKIDRSHLFWLQLLLCEIPPPPTPPPADRVIDVQGWLELLYEPGPHLVICGMNETFLPSRSGGEPWLSENIRKALKINTDTDRHARDAYLLHAMLKMREEIGSAHLICGKNGPGGETYLPSRLLLQVPRQQLVPTVKNLFREIEPPEANLVWTRDFEWQPPSIELPERISVTALRDYLACPFRFYLKQIVRMAEPEPDRREMNARDFGSITHLVLEIWGHDTEARRITDPATLGRFLKATLDQLILEQFGRKPPLAIRIQRQAILQRLVWFANQQVKVRSEGWEIIDVERKLSIPSNGFIISGKIDRIDIHNETGRLRVIDYKTGDAKDVEKEHRHKITSVKTRVPAHFEEGSAPFQTAEDAKGKTADYFWKNLQLPLYALAENPAHTGAQPPVPTYVHLGKTEDNVKFTPWETFNSEDLASAKSCADWITASIRQRNFWPPAEKVSYDDFAILTHNIPAANAFSEPALL